MATKDERDPVLPDDAGTPGDETPAATPNAREAQRRAFLKSAANVAVTTTAVTLMLSAGTLGNRAVAASPDSVDKTGDAGADFNDGDSAAGDGLFSVDGDFVFGDFGADPAPIDGGVVGDG